MTWKAWRAAHPETTVLAPPDEEERYAATDDYYARYRAGRRPQFPVGPVRPDDRYPAMADVTVARVDGQPRCWPHAELDEGETRDGALRLVRKGRSVRVYVEDEEVPTMLAYWFAWTAFFGEGGTVYRRPE